MIRTISHTLEYVLVCVCNRKYAYADEDINKGIFRCPFCGNLSHLDGSHDTFSLVKTKIHYPDKKTKKTALIAE